MRKRKLLTAFISSLLLMTHQTARAQELEAKVTINRAQVSDTKGDVFESLEKKVTEFLNDQKWTELKLRDKLFEKYGFTVANVVAAVKEVL